MTSNIDTNRGNITFCEVLLALSLKMKDELQVVEREEEIKSVGVYTVSHYLK
jgi:hypothetical protein